MNHLLDPKDGARICKEIPFFKGPLNDHRKDGMGKLDSKHRAWQVHLLHFTRVTSNLACVLDNPDDDGALPPRDVLIRVFALVKDFYDRMEEDRKGFSLPASFPQSNALFSKDDLATAGFSQGLNRYGSGGKGDSSGKGKFSEGRGYGYSF